MNFITTGSNVFDLDDNEYLVQDVIGVGGFGKVFKIEKIKDKSVWALKTLLSNISKTSEVQGLINDALNAIRIEHKNVINYKYFHDGTRFQNLPLYIIMEYAEEGTFLEFLDYYRNENRFIKKDEIFTLMRSLIDGAEAINEKIIHRDLKPANILINNNLLKISDFGLSKLVNESTRAKTFKGFGSFAYTSPEVWNAKKNTISMDIYSMGIIFYEICTLKNPYDVESNDFILWRDAHLYNNPPSPITINNEIPLSVDKLIMKMIEKNPEDRYQKWSDVRNELNYKSLVSSSNSKNVDDILGLICEKNKKDNELLRISQEKLLQKNNYKKRISSQFEKIIFNPLKEFIEELNNKSSKDIGNIEIQHSGNIISCQLHIQRLNSISINMQILHADEYKIKVLVNDIFKGPKVVEKFGRPSYGSNEIMMWGIVKDNEGKGFNIVFLENDKNEFGSWLTITNKNSGLNQNPRFPEPFPFVFEEIERELQAVNSMHIYESDVKAFDIEVLYQLLKNKL